MSPHIEPTSGAAPFTRDEIVHEVRRATLALASLIAHYGSFNNSLMHTEQYLGVSLEDYQYETMGRDERLDLIPIEEHNLYRVVMDAYDYAYQTGGRGQAGMHLLDQLGEVSGILTGFPRTDWAGEPSPLDTNNPSKLRQVLDTFVARFSLDAGEDLSVRQLALLGDMTEAAVRTSLSSAGIRTVSTGRKGDLNLVAHAEALSWLMGRRGFTPSAPNETLAEHVSSGRDFLTLGFVPALARAIGASGLDVPALSEKSDISPEWLQQVSTAVGSADVDVAALERLARVLGLPVPLFVGRAVTELLQRKSNSGREELSK